MHHVNILPEDVFSNQGFEERSSFLKKRSKRLLILALRQDRGPFPKHWGLDLGSGGGIKVFWFFSSEKNILLC
jgi:hypothetical protein